MRLKQVILIRKDLKMRRGKEIAQGSHASMEFVNHRLRDSFASDNTATLQFSQAERDWMINGMAKVCLQVQSESELLKYHQAALEAGLSSHIIRDSGRTEFNGVPTYTACAIGPDYVDKIDAITGGLKLY